MTITSITAKNQHNGNGATTEFAYQFKVFDQAHLKVYLNDVLQAAGYTVSGVGNDNGGSVTFAAAPANGVKVTLKRQLDLKQELDLPSQGAFPSGSVEDNFDKLVMMLLDLDERLGRTLLLAISSALTGVSLPTPEAGKALGWNGTQDGLTNVAAAGGVTVSSAMVAPVNAASTSQFLDLVGASASGKSIFTAATALGAALATAASLAAQRTALELDNALPNLLVNGGMQVAQRAVPNLSTSHQYGKVDRWAGRASAGSVSAGTITQATGSAAASTGLALNFSGTTLTGSAKVAARYRMEAKDAVRLKNKTVTFSARLWHDIGASKNATVTFNKANAADDFSAVTAIATSSATAIPDQAATVITHTQALGDCANGLELILELDTGAITTKAWHIGEAGLYLGTAAPASFLTRPFEDDLRACMRYFEKTFPYATAPAQNLGSTAGAIGHKASGTEQFSEHWHFKVCKRAVPTITRYAPSGGGTTEWHDTNGATLLASGVGSVGETGALIVSTTSLAVSNSAYIHVTADAEL
jgi:hypothetical protein